MMKVGLTGGIGSGKTAVSDYFQELGIPVLDTDVIARLVVQRGSETLRQICAQFGDHIVDKQGDLLRKKLRAEVFADPQKREQLENIIHPAIHRYLQKQLNALSINPSPPYCIIVIPLLLEKNWLDMVDRVLVVTAASTLRTQRIKMRQKITQQEIEQIMQSQVSDDKRLEIADDVLSNDGSLQQLHQNIDRLHRQYLKIANQVSS